MNKFYVVYDFDSPIYGASTILEDRYIVVKHISSGREKEFKNVTEFRGRGTINLGGWLKETNEENGTNFVLDDFEITQKAKRNSVPFTKAQEFIRSSADCIKLKPWCNKVKYVIGGMENYRKVLRPEYKEGRPPKPLMYSSLREWFVEEYKDEIIISDNCEADDVLSIFGWYGYNKALKSGDYHDDNVCLVFIDKDILQVPGWYWNFNQKIEKPKWQTELKAYKSFWKQMLKGDVVDNIRGLEGVSEEIQEEYQLKVKGVGEKNSLILLSGCDTKEDMEERVLFLYKDYYGEDEYKEEFQKNYQLLKLQEKRGVIPLYEFD